MHVLVASELSGVGTVLGLLSIPILVALNGAFVAAEFALVGVRKTRIEELVAQGVHGAKAVETAISHLDRYIAATQLGITLASIGLGWIGERALESVLHPLFEAFPVGWNQAALKSVAWGLAFFLITFMHVVFGELIPKTVALQSPDDTALWVARPLVAFARLTRPLILVMNGTGNQLLRWCGYHPAGAEEMVHSVEELSLLIEDTEEAGILGPEQARVVQNVFRLSGKRVGDCMVPVEKMAALELHTLPDKVLEIARRGAHTRMPVYDGQPDNVVGIVNTKDLFYIFSLRDMVILEDALYPALFVKPDQSLGEALRLLRESHRHMAVAKSEDGKVVGLITLEDILEEIVGDIEDEHDRPTPKVSLRARRIPPRPTAGKP